MTQVFAVIGVLLVILLMVGVLLALGKTVQAVQKGDQLTQELANYAVISAKGLKQLDDKLFGHADSIALLERLLQELRDDFEAHKKAAWVKGEFQQ